MKEYLQVFKYISIAPSDKYTLRYRKYIAMEFYQAGVKQVSRLLQRRSNLFGVGAGSIRLMEDLIKLSSPIGMYRMNTIVLSSYK